MILITGATNFSDLLKGKCHEIIASVFSLHESVSPSPRVTHLDPFKFFLKFAEIFASQGAPPVSTTPVAILPPVLLVLLIYTGGKFATGVNDTGGKQWDQYQTTDNLT
jgi:hypothetical protein